MIDENDSKYLGAGRLVELLNRIDPDDRVYPNRVGNLTITDKDGNYKCFIDFISYGETEYP